MRTPTTKNRIAASGTLGTFVTNVCVFNYEFAGCIFAMVLDLFPVSILSFFSFLRSVDVRTFAGESHESER